MENKYSFKTSETTINDKLSSKYHVTTIKEIQSHTYIHNKESCANFGKPRKTYTKTIDKAKAQTEFHETIDDYMDDASDDDNEKHDDDMVDSDGKSEGSEDEFY
ncbi:unnamed protein product [Brassica oleracea]